MLSNPRDGAGVGARGTAGTAVLIAGVTIYVVALTFVAVVNGGRIRYTADSTDTIPMWHPWLPVILGIALCLMVRTTSGRGGASSSAVKFQALVLLGLAVAFTVLLDVLGPAEPRYLVLKSILLVVGPLVLFAATRRRRAEVEAVAAAPTGRWWPLMPAAGWVAAHLALSTTIPAATVVADTDPFVLVSTIAIGFLVNAVVEELFYRKWLQSPWARLLGGVWPAIIVSSLAWASWHVAIQGSGDVVADLANVVANQGVTGLFLGLLWARHRSMWPLLIVHGVMNANPLSFF